MIKKKTVQTKANVKRNLLSWLWEKAAKRNKQEKPWNKANGQFTTKSFTSGISQHDAEYSGSNPFRNSSFEPMF